MIDTKRGARRPTTTGALRRASFIALVMIVGSSAGFAAHLPSIPETAFEVHTHGRLFYSAGDLSGMIEYAGRFEGVDREFRYQSVTLGGYYRLLPNLKAGAFYRLQFNVRHDDDWIADGSDWLWVDAAGRAEHVAMVDLTPRFLFPGGPMVLSSKFRYEYNITNGEQSLFVRPGLTYFIVRDREPLLNVSAQYATYFSLNFGAVGWYRQGPYVNLLYHMSPNIMIDVSASKQIVYWSESEEFIAEDPTGSYPRNVYSPWLVDVGFILRFR